jgi:beta-lactamase class A
LSFAQLELAQGRVEQVVRDARGVVGVAIRDLRSGDSLSVHGGRHFPMQSVYKFPLALAVLDRVDKGTMALTQTIHVTEADLAPDTWSPLRERFPGGNVDVRLDTLLQYVVAYSDNNVCDILFRSLGGTDTVNRYVQGLGVSDMAIAATEGEMHKAWDVQYCNWSSPVAMARLLQLFSDGQILSDESRGFLWKVMVGTRTGPKRIKGLLPAATVVAHKTGSSGTDERGIAAATNDAGVIVFPDGRRVVVVVFVSDSDDSEERRDMVIASIARAVWDAYSRN